MLRKQWRAIIIFLVAVIFRIALLLVSISQTDPDYLLSATPDTVNYVSMAGDLVDGTNTNQKGFFSFGPGYASFLALSFAVFGQKAIPAVLIQILLFGAACVILSRLALSLTGSHTVALIAGLTAAISWTAVTLSCMLLSDCLYFVMFTASVYLFYKGLTNDTWKHFLTSGLVMGLAVLVRPIGQFWPIMLMLIAVLYQIFIHEHKPTDTSWRAVAKGLKKPLVTALIIVTIASLWIVRNQNVHGIAAMAFTSAGGPANVAASALGSIEDRSRRSIIDGWIKNYLKENNKSQITVEEQYRLYVSETRKVLRAHPFRMAKEYIALAWTNLNEISYLHRLLIPEFDTFTKRAERWVKSNCINYLDFIFSLLGITVLTVKRRYAAVIILGAVYLYYFGMIGSYPHQGSRYFLPGQLASSILLAGAATGIVQWISKGIILLKPGRGQSR